MTRLFESITAIRPNPEQLPYDCTKRHFRYKSHFSLNINYISFIKNIVHNNIMKTTIKNTIIFGSVMTLIDIAWISYVMSKFYKNVFNIKFNRIAGILAYLCMIITYPLIISKFEDKNEQFRVASIIGLCVFGTYGFTLAAIYNKYPMKLALLESIWGMVLFSSTIIITNTLI